jgi:hypothetical protein
MDLPLAASEPSPPDRSCLAQHHLYTQPLDQLLAML